MMLVSLSLVKSGVNKPLVMFYDKFFSKKLWLVVTIKIACKKLPDLVVLSIEALILPLVCLE